MIRDRALEIIAAYGADAARWPDDERAGVQALVAADADVATARAEAAALDAQLAAWARELVPDDAIAASRASIAVVERHRQPRFRTLWAGLAVAASIAVGVLLLPRAPSVDPAPTPVITAASIDDAQTFALFFTPTPDEESLI